MLYINIQSIYVYTYFTGIITKIYKNRGVDRVIPNFLYPKFYIR
jgi:hypothetical protein